MEIREFSKECFKVAREHGFWVGMSQHPVHLVVGQKLALITSEVSEALEEMRSNPFPAYRYYRPEDSKPEGLQYELADAVIRIFDLCEWLGLDIEAAMLEKNQFNKSRPYLHNKAF